MTSDDAADDATQTQRSQLRKRFDLGVERSADAPRSISNRETARPPGSDDAADSARSDNTRPTIPTPQPRLALGCVPRRIVDDGAMLKLPLDHRMAFVLTHIDGKTNLRTLVDVTSMMPDEVVALVERLVELRAISVA